MKKRNSDQQINEYADVNSNRLSGETNSKINEYADVNTNRVSEYANVETFPVEEKK